MNNNKKKELQNGIKLIVTNQFGSVILTCEGPLVVDNFVEMPWTCHNFSTASLDGWLTGW